METFLAKIDKKMGENGIFGRNFDYFCFSKDVFFDVVTSLCYFPTLLVNKTDAISLGIRSVVPSTHRHRSDLSLIQSKLDNITDFFKP